MYNATVGDAARLNLIAGQGARLNVVSSEGLSALMYASNGGHLECVRSLCDRGAAVNATMGSLSPLVCAAVGGHAAVLQLLLERGASVDHEVSVSALGHLSGMIPFPLFFGQGVMVQEEKGEDRMTALALACAHGHDGVVALLLAHGANIHHGDRTALMLASEEGRVEVVRRLLGHDASCVNATMAGEGGHSALTFAVRRSHLAVVKVLCAAGADMYHEVAVADSSAILHEEARFYDRMTVLMMACADWNLPMVEFFCDRGMNINAQVEGGASALMVAAVKGAVKVVEFLCDRGVDLNLSLADTRGTALSLAAYSNRVHTARVLCERGAALEVGDGDHTPFYRACIDGYYEMAGLLFDAGSNIDHKNASGRTALMHASAEGEIEMVQFLLERNASVTAVDIHQETALHLAAGGDCVEIVKLLCSKGSSVNAIQENGRTPLHLAAIGNFLSVAEYLVLQGADTRLKTTNGNTAYDIARKACGNTSPIVLFLESLPH